MQLHALPAHPCQRRRLLQKKLRSLVSVKDHGMFVLAALQEPQ